MKKFLVENPLVFIGEISEGILVGISKRIIEAMLDRLFSLTFVVILAGDPGEFYLRTLAGILEETFRGVAFLKKFLKELLNDMLERKSLKQESLKEVLEEFLK